MWFKETDDINDGIIGGAVLYQIHIILTGTVTLTFGPRHFLYTTNEVAYAHDSDLNEESWKPCRISNGRFKIRSAI